MKILMSKDNPEGRKLEELGQDIIDDLTEKNTAFSLQMDKIPDMIKFSTVTSIVVNNELIIVMFKTIIEIQKRTMDLLQENFGKNRGPLDPRI